ncbi:cystathionine beta-lyase [Haemophilus seminalis]|uniref:Cystathionine beta-lyase n=1 Tax=Haemophilus seminalis TaxID=2582921 RepID=A0ABQ6SJR3_9PAST|nr:cystathionine beta-lyase [Haemophilus seminalis]
MGNGGILAYFGFISGRPDSLRGISPFMSLFSNRFKHVPTKELEGIL